MNSPLLGRNGAARGSSRTTTMNDRFRLVAVSRSRASTDRLHCKRKLRRGKRMQIESARARSAPDPLAGRRYRSLRLISSDGLRSAAEFNPPQASVHHFGKESQRRSTEKSAGAPSTIETHQAGEKSRSDGHPFRQCIAGILLGIKQHHASLGDLRVSVPDRVWWRSEWGKARRLSSPPPCSPE